MLYHLLRSLLASTLLLTSIAAATGTEGRLTLATDLQADGRESHRLGIPILLFYSLKGCPYCETIRASHLLPLQSAPVQRAIIRQVNLQESSALKDFSGNPGSHREYSRANGIHFAPVVVLVDREGRTLTDPLKGAMLPDFYGAHLDEALTTATKLIRARPITTK